MRNRYLPLAAGGRPDQMSCCALRAAATARSTSAGPASVTSASTSSVAGEMVLNARPATPEVNSPPMKRPYDSRSETTARDSGAGAYSSFAMSVQGEVVRAGVAAGGQLGALHEQVVQQAGGAEAEPAGVQPVLTRRLVDQDQVADGVLGGADAAGGLDADLAAVVLAEVADGLQHDQGHRERGGGGDLTGRGLDEVGARQHGQPRSAPHVVQRDQFAGLQDHLEMGSAAGLLDRDDLVEDLLVAAGEEAAPVDHHVHLVGAGRDRVLHVGQLDVQAGPAARERGGHTGHVHAAAF